MRVTLQPLLAEVIVLQRGLRQKGPGPTAGLSPAVSGPAEPSPSPADALFERWGAVPNDATRAIARLVSRAFFLYRWRWLLIVLIVLTGMGIYKGAPIAAGKLRSTLQAASIPTETSVREAAP